MSAAAAIAAVAAQKDMVWIQCGKAGKSLDAALPLYSLFEVMSSNGTGPEAVLSCKCIQTYYDEPINFLPQHGGFELGESVDKARKDTLSANPPSQDNVQDLADLDFMHEPALLHCMGMRYCGGSKSSQQVKSYYSTFIGKICVAVNPFAPQKAWVNSFDIKEYLAAKPDVISCKRLEPHSWTVADLAYTEMLRERKNQAILICGESGAGKTECCKFVLQYLMHKKASTVENLSDKIMATNDPLEAFGNAKTVNNDNSSRFAKCMQVSLDDQGRVIGAKIETSLLEKSRTCAFFRWERNFHIFYMLCYYRHSKCQPEPGEQQDTDNSDAAELLGPKAYKYLLTADRYDFTATGDTEKDEEGPYSGPGHSYRTRFQASDIDWFKKVMSAFRNSLGYTADETNQMMELLTAILHMGNIKFAEGDKSQVFCISFPLRLHANSFNEIKSLNLFCCNRCSKILRVTS
jgi:hypothetical protein